MYNAFFAGTFDITELVLYAFFGFFALLVLYISRESRREGFPLEHDSNGKLEPMPGSIFGEDPKVFKLPHGMGEKLAPDYKRDPKDINARQAGGSGMPFVPNGDPMTAGVGPGSYAQRLDIADQMAHGGARIVPLRVDPAFSIDKADPNMIGMPMVGVDGKAAGTIADIWVDRSEYLVRYLEVALSGGGSNVLIPMNMCTLERGNRRVVTDSVKAEHFAGAPRTASPEQITRLEEEKVMAYFGAGYLYATPERSEPVI